MIHHIRRKHLHVPRTKREQREKNIVESNPNDYMEVIEVDWSASSSIEEKGSLASLSSSSSTSSSSSDFDDDDDELELQLVLELGGSDGEKHRKVSPKTANR